MLQTPNKKLSSQKLNFFFRDDLEDLTKTGFLSTRDYPYAPLQYTASKNLEGLLAEMDALREEIELKMGSCKQLSNLTTHPTNSPAEYHQQEEDPKKRLEEFQTVKKRENLPKNQSEDLQNQKNEELHKKKLETLQNQNLEILRLYKREEEEHQREKAKWSEQVRILKIEIGQQGSCETSKKQAVESVLQENKTRIIKVDYFEQENKDEDKGLKEQLNWVLREKEIMENENRKAMEQIRKLETEVRGLREHNEKLRAKEVSLEDLKKENNERCRGVEEDRFRLLEENNSLKERFGRYQEEQEKMISELEEEVSTLVNIVNFLIREKNR